MGGSTPSLVRKARDLGGTAAAGLGAGVRTIGGAASSLTASASDAAASGFNAALDHASDLGSVAKQRLHEGSSTAASAGSGITASVEEGVDAATNAAGDAASTTRATVGRMGSQAGDSAANLLATLRDGFNDLLEHRPLVLGALGLAVGAGVAAVLPHFAAEEAIAGTMGNLKQSVRDGFSDAYTRATNEARTQA